MSQAHDLAKRINALLMDIDGTMCAGSASHEGVMSLVQCWRRLKEAVDALPADTFKPKGLAVAEAGLRRLADAFAQAVGDAEADEAAEMEALAEAEAVLEATKARLATAKVATAKAHAEIRGIADLLG